jgi:hypothetical protein
MALRKIIEAEGKCILQTSMGNIENGVQRVSFSAYTKVVGISGTKSVVTANVIFQGENQHFYRQYQIPMSTENNAPNFIAQVYEHLKTLPDFAGAEDC